MIFVNKRPARLCRPLLFYFVICVRLKVPSATLMIPYAPNMITRPIRPQKIALRPSSRFFASPACAINSKIPQMKTIKAPEDRSRIIGLTICMTTFERNAFKTDIVYPPTWTPACGTPPVGPEELPKLKVPVKIFTRPQTESITTKPMSPQSIRFLPFVFTSSLLAPRMNAWNAPQRNTMNAMAKRTGTRILFMVLIMNEPASEILLMAANETSGKASASEEMIRAFFIIYIMNNKIIVAFLLERSMRFRKVCG